MQSNLLNDRQRDFLDELHYGVAGTLNSDGSIQQTVIWFIREGDELRFGLGSTSVKARNLRRNPTITLTVEDGPRYLTVSGVATVEPADPELRARIALRYLGPERVAAWLERPVEVVRATVRVSITRVYGQGL